MQFVTGFGEKEKVPGLAPTIALRNGADIPVLGIGTSPLQGEDSVRQIEAAIEAGYRLIDTAENYRNEEAVGEGIRNSGIDRDEMFLTTKFNRQWHSIDGVREAYDASRKRLGVRLHRPAAGPLAQPGPGPLRRGRAGAAEAAGVRRPAGHRSVQLQAGAPAAGAGRDGHHPRRSTRSSSARTAPGDDSRAYHERARHRHRVLEPARGVQRRAARRPDDRADRRGARQVDPPRWCCAGTCSWGWS